MEPSKQEMGKIARIVRQHLLTRENAWAILVALMLLLVFILGTMGVQPRFVYSGF